MADLTFLPYGKHQITEEDIDAVSDVLRSDWLTQGPAVTDFEDALADFTGAKEIITCSSGTAALHLAMLALGLGKGDVVIIPSNSFVAATNCARFVGASVRFADIDPETGLIDPKNVARLLEEDADRKIKAVIPFHFAGQPVDLPVIYDMAKRHGAWVIDDAGHAIGASYDHNGNTYRPGGNPHSDLTVFSFHANMHIAMGEGGAVATNHTEPAGRIRLLRNHGLRRNQFVNGELSRSPDGVPNPWYYEISETGYNFRLTDIQAALGLSQMKRLPSSLERRREIADRYRRLIAEVIPGGKVRPLEVRPGVKHAYHLFVVRIDFDHFGVSRAVAMNRMRVNGIGAQVHYVPLHLQPYYRNQPLFAPADLPGAEKYYAGALSLPMYPDLTDEDIQRVVEQLTCALTGREQHLFSPDQTTRQPY